MPTTTAILCAWCLRDEGMLSSQQDDDSHGICPDHANKVLATFQSEKLVRVTREFNRVPPYFERFSDGRETF